MPLQLEEYLPNLDDTPIAAEGRPMLVPLDLIDEDPLQPRSEFDAETLGELAKTIAARGVLQPVSVRSHPEHAGRWMLNFGARRLRASKMAGKDAIPAFVDEPADRYVKVIENEHREGLNPMELASFLKEELNSGKSRAEVARNLGKSAAYLSYVSALIDAEHWLKDAYRSGQCRGLRELCELRRAHEVHPEDVRRLIDSGEPITRAGIKEMLGHLTSPVADKGRRKSSISQDPEHVRDARGTGVAGSPSVCDGTKETPIRKHQASGHLSLVVRTPDGLAEVLFDALPESKDEVFVVCPISKTRRLMKLAELHDLRLLRS